MTASAYDVVDINALALLVLGCIGLNSIRRRSRSHVQHGLYLAMAATLAFLLVLDSATRLVDGIPGGYYWNWALNIALYLVGPVMPALWALYADYQVHRDRKRLKRLYFPLALFILLNAAATFATITTGWIFTVSAGNVYSRGPLIWLVSILNYSLLLYTLVFIIINRKRIDDRNYVTLLAFPLPPAIGGILQSIFYGLSLILSGMSLSLMLIYFNRQDRRLDTDYLTGVYNRRLLDSFMKERAHGNAAKKAFSAILIDLDCFKSINDRLGHKTGDDALTDTVGLLKGCLRHGDFISRYGGDEFLIILDIDNREALEETVKRLRETFRQFNEGQTRPYELGFSTGYDIFDPAGGGNADEFVRHVDELMYADKKNKQQKTGG